MRICWDELEGIYLSKLGNFRKGSTTYILLSSCNNCGVSYLTEKSRPSKYCSNFCAVQSKEFNNCM